MAVHLEICMHIHLYQSLQLSPIHPKKKVMHRYQKYDETDQKVLSERAGDLE